MYSSLSRRENSEGGRGEWGGFPFVWCTISSAEWQPCEVYIEIFVNLLLGISFPFDFPFLTGIPGFSVKWLIFQKSSNCWLSGNFSRKFTYPFRNFWDFWFNGKHPLLKCATIPPYLENKKKKINQSNNHHCIACTSFALYRVWMTST